MLTCSTGAILQSDITVMTSRIIFRILIAVLAYLLISFTFKVGNIPPKKNIRSFHILIKCFLIIHLFFELSFSIIVPSIVLGSKANVCVLRIDTFTGIIESPFHSSDHLAMIALTFLIDILSLAFTNYMNQ